MAKSINRIDEQAIHPSTLAILLLVGGFSCFIAWPLVAILNMPQTIAEEPLVEHSVSMAIFSLIGVFAILLCSLNIRFARYLYQHRAAFPLMLGIAVAMVALATLAFAVDTGIGLPLPVHALIWFSAGVSFGLMLLLWGSAWDAYVALYGKKDLTVNLILAIAIAGLTGAGITTMFRSVHVASLAIVPIASLAFYLALVAHAAKKAEADAIMVDGIVKMPGRHASYVVVISAYCSFILFFAAETLGTAQALVISCGAVLITCVLFSAIKITRGSLPRFLLVERVAFPVAISGAIVSPFLDNQVITVIVLFIGALGTSAFMTSHWELLVKWSLRFKLQSIYHYSYGTFTLAGGFLFGAVANQAILFFELPMSLSLTVICLFFMLCIITVTAFSPYDSESVFNSFEQGVVKLHNQEGIWRSAIEAVTREFQLTPRQSEILGLLSRGRSVKYISSQLCVSEHTTKTHVYHIYRKLGINGLQELIDIIDDKLKEARRLID